MQRHRALQPESPGAVPSAPRRLSYKTTDQCFQAHLPASLAGTGISKRPFTLPERLPVSRPPFRGRSSRPASSNALPYARLARSDYRSPTRPGSPRFAQDLRRNPVARLASGISRVSPDLHSPLGPFEPLRIKAFNPVPRRKVRLPNAPDCPSLPGLVLFY
jgi:hypothetical protein